MVFESEITINHFSEKIFFHKIILIHRKNSDNQT